MAAFSTSANILQLLLAIKHLNHGRHPPAASNVVLGLLHFRFSSRSEHCISFSLITMLITALSDFFQRADDIRIHIYKNPELKFLATARLYGDVHV